MNQEISELKIKLPVIKELFDVIELEASTAEKEEERIIQEFLEARRIALEKAHQLLTAVKDGEANPIRADLAFKFLEDAIKDIRTREFLKDSLIDEAEKHESKKFPAYGMDVTLTERSTYNYTHDVRWVAYNILKKEIEKELKKREKVLKTYSFTAILTDPGTGEKMKCSYGEMTRYLRYSEPKTKGKEESEQNKDDGLPF